MTIDEVTNRLLLPTLLNARDLGGFETTSGRRTAYRRFVRADEPSVLSSEDLDALLEYPVRTVVDLRDESEISRRPTPFQQNTKVRYVNVPLFGSDADNVDSEVVQIAVSKSLGALYIYVLMHRSEYLLSIFREIISAPHGAILFHCTHGKDRTGIVAALLLLIAGVSREDILRNYTLTYELIRPIVDPKIKNLPTHMHHILRSDKENMEMMLHYFDDSFGGSVELYFMSIGLTDKELDMIRTRIFA